MCDENGEGEAVKTTGCFKIILMKGGFYNALSEKWLNELCDIDSSNNEDTNTVVASKSG